ncbi:ABC transporter substrate-binding protein, partial [Acinetobacter baumannii]|uniref:ABC transporter substrate-binding protein n=3 Tax=Pseudomonadota TaxID=1224 RepID=UPI0020913AA1
GKELTFKLNPNAKFQNGDPVTSADVKASFERILNEATGAVARANFLSIANIEAVDPHTVVFHLSQPDVPLLTAMTN